MQRILILDILLLNCTFKEKKTFEKKKKKIRPKNFFFNFFLLFLEKTVLDRILTRFLA